MVTSDFNKLRMENIVLRDATRMALIALEGAESELREFIHAGLGSMQTRTALEQVQRAIRKLAVPPTWDAAEPPGVA